MKQISVLLVLWSLAVGAFAQFVPDHTFSTAAFLPCTDTAFGHNGFTQWDSYQTRDSMAFGTRDSSCFDVSIVPGGGIQIVMDQANDSFPIFLKCRIDSSNKVLLDSNNLYKILFTWHFDGATPDFLFGRLCPDGLCSGIQLGVEVPDSAGTGHNIRWHDGTMNVFGPYGQIEFCFPTERFPAANYLREIWFRLAAASPMPGMVVDNSFSPSIQLDDMRSGTQQVSRIDALGNFHDFVRQCSCANSLMLYTAPTYPSVSQPSYVEVFPSPNTTAPQNITLDLTMLHTLHFQPYTSLRGGQVVGDTLRHAFTLINDGGTICANPFVELVFEHDDSYRYRSGKLDFLGTTSCMSFGRGGRMIIEPGARLDYGQAGSGVLAWRTGGIIKLGEGSHLAIGGKLVLGEYRDESSPSTFAIHLPRESHLAFRPGARLQNYLSAFPEATFLDIYLDGGTVDLDALPPADRARVRIHQVVLDPDMSQNLQVLGNPFGDILRFVLTSHADIDYVATLTSLDGRVLRSRAARTRDGDNLGYFDTADLPAGLYVLRISTTHGSATRLLVHQ